MIKNNVILILKNIKDKKYNKESKKNEKLFFFSIYLNACVA